MNLLMTVAVIGAALIGQWPEAAVVIWLFGIAEMIEALSLDRARNAIRKLMDLAPENALVRQPDGQWREVKADTVPLGSVVRVRPGERIDRKSTRLNSSHLVISYAVFCLKKKKRQINRYPIAPCTSTHPRRYTYSLSSNDDHICW